MKNIKRIAEEIFQAPTKKELFERAIDRNALNQSQLFMTQSQLLSHLSVFRSLDDKSRDTIIRLFPKGAAQFYKSDAEFKLIKSMTKSRELIKITNAIGSVFRWFKAKIKDRNAIVYAVGSIVHEIYVEVK